jgi:hypothetical protein
MNDTVNTNIEPNEEVDVKTELIEPETSAENIEKLADNINNINITEGNTDEVERVDSTEKELDGPVNSTTPEDSTPPSTTTYENINIDNKNDPGAALQPVPTEETKSVVENSPRDTGHRVKRDTAAFEILHSERYYVQCLELIIQHLLTPLKKLEEDDRPIIEKRIIGQIFSNIETLVAVNKELLIRLEERMQNWADTQRLADIFNTMSPYLKTYCTYCDNYEEATATVNYEMHNNAQFRTFLQQFQKSSVAKKLDAFMYLIMPVQRIPRYVLLLQTLQHYTPPNDADYNELTTAIKKVKAVADRVNESVRNRENIEKVIEIQNKLVRLGNQTLVEPQRKFVKEGMLAKLSMTDDSLQTRAVYLFSDLLLTAVPLVGGLMKVDKMIPVLTACTMDSFNGPYKHMFYLVSPLKTHAFVCTNKDDKSEWVQKINQAIAELVSSNPALAAQRNEIELEINEEGIPYMKIAGTRMVKQTSRLKLNNIVGNTFERIKSVVTFQRPKSVSLERAEKDDLEDFVMIPDLHKPSVRSPRSASESASDTNAAASVSSPTRPTYDNDSGSTGSGGYVTSTEDKYSLAAVIEHSSDFNGPIEHDLAHSSLEESTLFEESPSENNDIPDYLWNHGAIQIASKLAGLVTECAATELIREDPLRHKHLSTKSTYLVFGESGNKGAQIGHISLQNIGDAPIVLIAHQRKLDNPRSAIFILRGRTKLITDYRGLWCIEVNRGDCSNLVVFDFSSNRGTGKNNELGMVHG